MKQIKKVSLIGALVLIISAVVLISGCSQAPAPAPTPAPTPAPVPAPEAEIEGTPWKCIYTTNVGWEDTVLMLNGTTATFKDPDKSAYTVSCVIDKVNKKIKLVFSNNTDEYDYVIKENGSVLEFAMNGRLKHKFRKL